ncbi:unnamed protein product, partial [Phaeothamnion confervicola]
EAHDARFSWQWRSTAKLATVEDCLYLSVHRNPWSRMESNRRAASAKTYEGENASETAVIACRPCSPARTRLKEMGGPPEIRLRLADLCASPHSERKAVPFADSPVSTLFFLSCGAWSSAAFHPFLSLPAYRVVSYMRREKGGR